MQRSFKKPVAVALTCMMLFVLVLAACSSSSKEQASSPPESSGAPSESASQTPQETQPEKPVVDKNMKGEFTLTGIWDGSKEGYQGLVDDFNKEYPNIKVNLLLSTEELDALIAAGSKPDLYQTIYADPKMVANELLEDLTPYLQREEEVSEDLFIKPLIEKFKYKGSLYGLPWNVDPNFAVGYNKQLFDEMGITEFPQVKTLKDYEDISSKFFIVDKGKQVRLGHNPFLESYGRVNALMTFAYLNGATPETFYNPDTMTVTFNDPKIVESLEWMLQFMNKYVDSERMEKIVKPEGLDNMSAGIQAMKMLVAQEAITYNKKFPDMFAFVPMPTESQWLSGYGWVMVKGTKNGDAAWEFMKWLMTTQNGVKSSYVHFGIMATLQNNPFLDAQTTVDPVLKVYADILKTAQKNAIYYMPNFFSDIFPEFNDKLRAAQKGELTAKEVLDHITSFAQQIVDEFKAKSGG